MAETSKPLVWDKTGEKTYETGVKNGALYVQDSTGAYPEGVAWNGLTSVSESPSGAEQTALYADDSKYLSLTSAEEFGATIEAYTYPEEFEQCDGTASIAKGVTIGQQSRKAFGMAYKTTIGNDVDNNDYGYKLHLIYGALAAPSEKAYNTINDSPEAITFSWEVTTTPVPVTGKKPTASLVINSTKCDADKLAIIEAILYGANAFSESSKYAINALVTHESKLYKCKTPIDTPATWNAENWIEIGTAGPRLPLPDEIAAIMGDNVG